MIQRIQTIWLLLTLGCMIAFIVLPFGSLNVLEQGTLVPYQLFPYDFIGLIIPAGLAVVMSLIAIFTFRNLGLQKSVTLLTLMMVVVSIGITVYVLCDRATMGQITWCWPTAFLAGALLFSILALTGINHDIKLLRSYDRLR